MISATRGFRVGRISGVEVRLDWSLLIVFWLIVMNLGGGLFPARHPEWSPWLGWGMAATAAVLFVLSILAHELSHALVGRANGVAVAGITLFIFGGVAHMRGEPRSPRAELLMTVVGPLTSLAIGLLATAGGAYLASPAVIDAADPFRAFQRVGPFATVLLWLGPINIMIGLFNLIPAYPLDGGRVLRAALWAATRDLAKATRWAAFVGQAFGMLLIILGVSMVVGVAIPWLGRGLISGLWTAFIGWFLYGAAAASTSQVMLSELLEGVPVSRLMKHQPATIDVGPSGGEAGRRPLHVDRRAGVSGRRWRPPAWHRRAGGRQEGAARGVADDAGPRRDDAGAGPGGGDARRKRGGGAHEAGEPRRRTASRRRRRRAPAGHASPPRHPALAGASTARRRPPRPRTTRLQAAEKGPRTASDLGPGHDHDPYFSEGEGS